MNTLYPFTVANFQDDDWNVRFNTGLPSFKLLKTVCKFVSLGRFKRANSANALSDFQEFVTTLIKLMLNPPLRDFSIQIWHFPVYYMYVPHYVKAGDNQRRLVTLLNCYQTHIPDDVRTYSFART